MVFAFGFACGVGGALGYMWFLDYRYGEPAETQKEETTTQQDAAQAVIPPYKGQKAPSPVNEMSDGPLLVRGSDVDDWEDGWAA